MKKKLLALTALLAITFSSFARTDMTYKVVIERESNGKYEAAQTATLSIVNGGTVEFSDIKSYTYISEFNSINGAIEIKTGQFFSGSQLSIEPKGDENVSLRIKVLDRNIPVVTGTYEFKLETGKIVNFPAGGNLRLVVQRES